METADPSAAQAATPTPATSARLTAWLRHLSLERLLGAEAFVLIAGVALLTPTQNDTWWHLRAGREIVATGRVSLTDTWSHTAAGAVWPNHEWLTEVVFYGLYRLGGLPLLTAACAALIVLAYAVAWRQMRGTEVVRGLLLVAALSASTSVWAVRPQVITLFLFSLTLAALLNRRELLLPPLFLVWANLHGAVALGLVLVGAAAAAAALGDRRRLPRLLGTGAACALATFITPLGVRYWPEVLISLRRSQVNAIDEWQAPTLAPEFAVFWLALAALAAVTVRYRRRLREFTPAFLVIASALLALLALRAVRNVPLFLLVAGVAATRVPPAHAPDTSAPVTRGRAAVHLAVLAASVVLAAVLVGRQWRADPSPLGWTPMSAAAANAIAGCPPPIYNPYNEGGFILWFAPEQRVFLDSRQDPYPVSLVQAHLHAERSGEMAPLLEKYRIQCVVLPARSPTRAALDERWTEAFRDDQWVVLIRSSATR